MSNNNKGVTLIELLISISIGSVILMMLMGILSSSLLAKNEAEYINRLNDEVFYMNEVLIDYFKDSSYTSIEDISPTDIDVTILLITEEYKIDLVDNTLEFIYYRPDPDNPDNLENYDPDHMHQNILVLDRRENTNGLYYGAYTSDAWDNVNYVFNDLIRTRLNGPNLIFTENAKMSVRNCIRTFNLQSDYLNELKRRAEIDDEDYICARAFVEFDFELEYNLVRGNKLSPRRFTSTLFF